MSGVSYMAGPDKQLKMVSPVVYYEVGGEDTGTGEIEVQFVYINPMTGKPNFTSRFCSKGGSVTPPAIGDVPAIDDTCPALTFTGWSSDSFSDIQHDFSSGAFYKTTDTRSYFLIDITQAVIDSASLYLRISPDDYPAYSDVDYGDGTTKTVYQSSIGSDISINVREYTTPGVYLLSFNVRKNDGTPITYRWSDIRGSGQLLGTRNDKLIAVFTSEYCRYIQPGAFQDSPFLEYVTVWGFGQTRSNQYQSLLGGNGTFSGCYNLKYMLGRASGTGMLGNCYSLRVVDFDPNVGTLGGSNCINYVFFETIVVPESVVSIASSSITAIFNLRKLVLKPATPPTLGSGNFAIQVHPAFKIYVPQASLEAYQTATNWSVHASRMVGY